MRPLAHALLLLGLGLGCDWAPGKPTEADRPRPPDQVLEFEPLWATNCAGCHGDDGTLGPARPLADPLYQAWVSDGELTSIIASGVPGSLMPAFARSGGGMLTDDQVEVLVKGMREKWSGHGAPAGLPPYRAARKGSPAAGAAVYTTFCQRCHGAGGEGGEGAGSIVDGSFLALVSDQALRGAVVCGRPDLGAPDYRNNQPGRAMTDREITDVVAWLASQRVEFPGQVYGGRERDE